jgi:dienelactone hydrolase
MADTTRFTYNASAPLEITIHARQPRETALIEDLTYASPLGGQVRAYLITPADSGFSGRSAGLVFVHWGQGDREEFVEEALLLARTGVVSLCLDAPFRRPAELRSTAYDPEQEPEQEVIQLVTDVCRATDVLTAMDSVDPQRLGYVGHSYGATFGGVVAGVEHRLRACVLIGGYGSLTQAYRTSEHPRMAQERAAMGTEQWEAFLRRMEPFDAVEYLGQASPTALLLQFATQDEFVTAHDAQLMIDAASEPKEVRWYDSGHAFNDQARLERAKWLGARLQLPTDR